MGNTKLLARQQLKEVRSGESGWKGIKKNVVFAYGV
jgi:hypothetical protein